MDESGEATLSGKRARDPYRMSLTYIRICYVIELISLFFFYAWIVGMSATFFAQIFNVPQVYYMSRAQIITSRRQQTAVLMLPQCKLYTGNVTREEEAVFKKNDAHVLPVDICISAQTHLHEGEWTQVTRAVMNHYAICESGTCDAFFQWIVANAVYLVLVATSVLCVYLYFYSPRSNQDRIIVYPQNYTGKSVYGSNKKRI
jgi:hypothetical protein